MEDPTLLIIGLIILYAWTYGYKENFEKTRGTSPIDYTYGITLVIGIAYIWGVISFFIGSESLEGDWWVILIVNAIGIISAISAFGNYLTYKEKYGTKTAIALTVLNIAYILLLFLIILIISSALDRHNKDKDKK